MKKKFSNIKSDFPIFERYPDLVYLDSGATSQRPKEVIDAVVNFYSGSNANIHRGIYKLAEQATEIYEKVRLSTARFVSAKRAEEIVFTGNTNQAINLVAYGWGQKFLNAGDIIVLSEMEHHANIVPWLRLKEKIGVELIFLPINKEFRLDYKLFEGKLAERFGVNEKKASKIKLLALTQASNVLGTVNPIKEIVRYFRENGVAAKVLIDAAQSIPHMKIDVVELGVDFLAFSAHKTLGPTGVGVLWAREELLSEMEPLIVGSGMIESVSKDGVSWAGLPDKFEAGTGNLEGVAGLGAAISYLENVGLENLVEQERELIQYGLKKLKEIPYVKIYGPLDVGERLGIFSFGVEGVHPHDVAQVLDARNIAIRSGHHCAQVTMKALSIPATARASLYLYNTKTDIDKLVEGILEVKRVLGV